MSRDIKTFTSADDLAAHLIAGERVQLTPRREFKPESLIADIQPSVFHVAASESLGDATEAGLLIRRALVSEIKKAASELFAEWVQEDAA